MKRRDLLTGAGKFALLNSLASFGSLPAWAQAAGGPRFLISINFDEGWDVTLGLDPQVKPASFSDAAFFLGYGPGDITRAAGLHFGPSAAGLAEFANQAIVINGVSMQGNISHEDARRMASTGIIDRRTAEMTAMKSAFDKKPVVIAGNRSGRFEPGELNVDTTSVDDLKRTGDTSEQTDFLETDGAFAAHAARSDAFRRHLEKALAASPTFRAAYDVALRLNGDDAQPMMIAAALASRYTRAVHVNLNPATLTLDTHNDHAKNHRPAQQECWNKVIAIVRALQNVPFGSTGRSLYDETLIVVTSEFSRETCLNGGSISSAGKEHNGYTNSYLLLGGQVRGGYSIGGSIVQANALSRPSLHIARNFDFRSGQVIRTAESTPDYLLQNPSIKKQILPGHVVASIADIFGYRAYLDPVLAKLPTLPLRVTS